MTNPKIKQRELPLFSLYSEVKRTGERHSGRCFCHLAPGWSCLCNACWLSACLPRAQWIPSFKYRPRPFKNPLTQWPAGCICRRPCSVISACQCQHLSVSQSVSVYHSFNWEAQFNVDFKKFCTFHSYFQTLGFAPTHSLKCLFFFCRVKKKNSIAAGCLRSRISSVKDKEQQSFAVFKARQGNFIHIGHFMCFTLHQIQIKFNFINQRGKAARKERKMLQC